jgi:xanthine dehydrogenase accessory factor
MRVFIIDLDMPRCIRRNVCFASARYTGSHEVEGIMARKAATCREATDMVAGGMIPVLAGEISAIAVELAPDVIVDARMLKHSDDGYLNLAPLVIGLGPGFTVGKNAHAVVETKRGHNLGRVIYRGSAEKHTGIPAEVMGFTSERVVRAPGDGVFTARVDLGAPASRGTVLGHVDGRMPVVAEIEGMVRGLVIDGLEVRRGQKIGDIEPRSGVSPNTISDKGRAVAGGVLEAIMHWWTVMQNA